SLTKKDGVRSLLKGDNPFHSRPALLSRTRLPTTSDTGSRARNSSRNCGGKRMAARVRLGTRESTPVLYGHTRFESKWWGLSKVSTGFFRTGPSRLLSWPRLCIYELYIRMCNLQA